MVELEEASLTEFKEVVEADKRNAKEELLDAIADVFGVGFLEEGCAGKEEE
jgi:hypothetical protein